MIRNITWLSLLVRPRLCRCTVLGALPQSSGQSAGLIPASASPRAHLLRAFKPLLGLGARAAHDLVNVVHLWNLDSLLSRPQALLDCCFRGSEVSEVRLVLAPHVLHGGMRDLVLHCLAAKLLIWTLLPLKHRAVSVESSSSRWICFVLTRCGSALFTRCGSAGVILLLKAASSLSGLPLVRVHIVSCSGKRLEHDFDRASRPLFRRLGRLPPKFSVAAIAVLAMYFTAETRSFWLTG